MKRGFTLVEVLVVFAILAILVFIVVIPLVGVHIQTGSGEHSGYATSVETSGVFFKTHSAYIKTDTQSSQEDAYCVVDENVYEQLKYFVEKKTPITIKYMDWFSKGVANCAGEEGGVITSVSERN